MRDFKQGQKVRVKAGTTGGSDELAGKTGTVARLRRADSCAWVAMDCDLPDGLRAFPADDEHGRGRHIILDPSECEAVR